MKHYRVTRRPSRAVAAAIRREGQPLILDGMSGLGDNIYQRAVLSAFDFPEPVYLRTPWPQLYRGMGHVRCLPNKTPLRTQRKNLETQPVTMWSDPPRDGFLQEFTYANLFCGPPSDRARNVIDGLIGSLGSLQDRVRQNLLRFDLPDFRSYFPVHDIPRLAVVRPVTERREWNGSNRGPKPEYIQEAVFVLKRHGFNVVSVADIEEGEEWYVTGKPLEGCDIYFDQGELSLEAMLGLVQLSSLVVGGVGWVVPACVASDIPLYCILGGRGGHNHPDKITSPHMRGKEVTISWAFPSPYCLCVRSNHRCNKTIPDFRSHFSQWLLSKFSVVSLDGGVNERFVQDVV